MVTNQQSDAEQLIMPDADVILYRHFFGETESATLYQELADNIHWVQQHIRVPGGPVPLPRLTAWYGDEGKSYSYSGITVHPEPWIPILLRIKDKAEAVVETKFNSVLLNFYRSETDSVSWHSDDEPELGTNPVIASLSFGATRKFQFKHKQNPKLRAEVELTPGSLLLMKGATQHTWKHQIPKSKEPLSPRINLTFRLIQR